jgi:Ca2+-binding RTX toxin-like protein
LKENSMATITGSNGADTLNGTKYDDTITGLAGNDQLQGLEGDDSIDGGSGLDTMLGGIGNDTYMVDSTGDLVIDGKDEGNDVVFSTISHTLAANIEDLWLRDIPGAINGTGNDLDNAIYGNSRNNTLSGVDGDDRLFGADGRDTLLGGRGNDNLIGGSGIDSMVGGAGNDTYGLDDAGDVVTENANEGTDLVYTDIDYTLGANLENLYLYPRTAAVNGTGNALNNTITGNENNNVLDGRAGNDTLVARNHRGISADTLIGGTGDDVFFVSALDDSVVENAGEGIDHVIADTSYTLAANVEVLSFQRLFTYYPLDIDGIGNDLNNTMYGTDGVNVLSGRGGRDFLFGYEGADVLAGGDENDHLDGGSSADAMIGGDGNDGYVVDDAGDLVTENAGEGADFVDSWVTYTLGANVENLDLRGETAMDGTGNGLDNFIGGNSGNNVLTGSAGNDVFDGEGGADTILGGADNDTIDGGLGADSMVGGSGDDMYVLVDDGNAIVETADEGTDTVLTRVTHTLAANVENLVLHEHGGSINGAGNTLNNMLFGNSADNSLFGSGGGDTLTGADGGDTLFGGNGYDSIDGGIGNDTIEGGNGVDTMIGGAGLDTLTGGVGRDMYLFNLPTEAADVITDFVSGTDDFAIDNTGFGIAGTGTLAANGVAFVLGSAATRATASILFDAATHQVLWDADGTGAGVAQALATLTGVTTMSANDFRIV